MIVLAEPDETLAGLGEFKDSQKWNEIRKTAGETLTRLNQEIVRPAL